MHCSLPELRSSGVYVVYFHGFLHVRRVQLLSSKRVLLRATNPQYEDEEVSLRDAPEIIVCAKVKLGERDQLVGSFMRKIVE